MDTYQKEFKNLADSLLVRISVRDLTKIAKQFRVQLNSFLLFCCYVVLPSKFKIPRNATKHRFLKAAGHVEDATETIEETTFDESSMEELHILFDDFCRTNRPFLDSPEILAHCNKIFEFYQNCPCHKCRGKICCKFVHSCIYKSKQIVSNPIVIE